MRTLIRPPGALCLLAVLLAVATTGACGGSMTPSVLAPTVATITTLPSIDEMLADKTLGSGTQNTIIEYVSFWCSACKDFYLTGDGAQMKTQYADTGKAQITFRNLFLSGETFAAADLARCAGNARFFDAVDTIFRNQSSWWNANDPDAAVKSLMLGFGMSQSVVNACVENTALENGLAQIHMNAMAATYQLPDGTTTVGFTHVPAVVVNGVRLDGANGDGTTNADNAPTLANVQKFLKSGT
jgi:protein-disulfide isomerase